MNNQLFVSLLQGSTYSFRLAALPYLVAAVVASLAAILIMRWERGTRPSALIGGYSFLFCAWFVLRALIIGLDSPEGVLTLSRLSFGLVALSLPLLYWFICIVLQMEAARMPSIRLNLLFATVIALLSTGSPWLLDGRVDQGPHGYAARFGPLGAVLTAWIAGLILVSIRDLVLAWRRADRGSDQQKRVGLLALGCLALYLEATELVPAWGIDVVPLGYLSLPVFSGITAYLTWRYGLLQVTPELAVMEIASLVRGAVLIMDPAGKIHYANGRVVQILGSSQAGLIGSDARLLGLPFAPESVRELAHLHGAEVEKELLYRRPSDGATCDLVISALPVLGRQGQDVAYTCVIRDVTDQRRVEQERLRLSLHDPLTGLSNRELFLGRLDEAIQRARPRSQPLSVLFIGLRRLRMINEDLGYSVGDRVLQEVAARLRGAVDGGDAVARIGGDEFAVLIESAQSETALKELMAKLDQAISAPMEVAQPALHIAASIGAAGNYLEFGSGADLLRAAGVAMYASKQDGSGRAVTPASGSGLRTRLESELRRAVEREEFEAWFQPVVDIDQERITGFEALVRWHHPEQGILLPGKFIEFAEEIGLLAEIDRCVFEQACAGLARLQGSSGNAQLSVSLNLSGEQLRRPDLLTTLCGCIDRHRLGRSSVRVEVLESVSLNAAVSYNLQGLRRLGIGIYIDDFGIGYSALSRLHELPVTLLKIDREFVRAMTLGRGGEKTINSIIALARNLQLGVISEGVESAAEALKLREFGCRLLQGFYFSPAVPLAEAQALLCEPDALASQFAALRGSSGLELATA